jgi:hypothetical protein
LSSLRADPFSSISQGAPRYRYPSGGQLQNALIKSLLERGLVELGPTPDVIDKRSSHLLGGDPRFPVIQPTGPSNVLVSGVVDSSMNPRVVLTVTTKKSEPVLRR